MAAGALARGVTLDKSAKPEIERRFRLDGVPPEAGFGADEDPRAFVPPTWVGPRRISPAAPSPSQLSGTSKNGHRTGLQDVPTLAAMRSRRDHPRPPLPDDGSVESPDDAHTPMAAERARWERPRCAALLVATGVLYLWGLDASGWANSFYSAAAQAGSQSWKAWFFGSFDARARSPSTSRPRRSGSWACRCGRSAELLEHPRAPGADRRRDRRRRVRRRTSQALCGPRVSSRVP